MKNKNTIKKSIKRRRSSDFLGPSCAAEQRDSPESTPRQRSSPDVCRKRQTCRRCSSHCKHKREDAEDASDVGVAAGGRGSCSSLPEVERPRRGISSQRVSDALEASLVLGVQKAAGRDPPQQLGPDAHTHTHTVSRRPTGTGLPPPPPPLRTC